MPKRPEKLKLTAIDLFCGAGGLALGFEQAGFEVLGGVDNNPIALETYRRNFPNSVGLYRDIASLSGRELRKELGVPDTVIDVVFGGPPCQGFSLIGRRNPGDARNQMILQFARLLRELKPRYFVMENVKGLLFGNAHTVLDRFLEEVTNSGYSVVEPVQILNAADFGVPQRRERVFVLGYLKHEKPLRYPESGSTSSFQKPQTITVLDAIGDLPEVDNHEALLISDRYYGALGGASKYAQSLRTEQDIGYHGLSGCRRTIHTDDVRERFRRLESGGLDGPSRSRRLEIDGVAPTLRAGTGRTHGSYTALRPIHPIAPRYITVREAARLHSYPDWFEFNEAKWHALMGIGNSVPPALAKSVANSIIATCHCK